MNYKKLRTEKNCLNCGHEVEERFCSQCGQENLELKDSAIHLVLHYVQDLFHYDGKLWHTLKTLVKQPGQVPKEYMEGKRQSHLEPIRFYVFASSVFFLIFFFVLGSDLVINDVTPETNYPKRLFHLKQEKEFRKGNADTAVVNQLISSLQQMPADSISVLTDSIKQKVNEEIKAVQEDTTYEMSWLEKIFTEKYEAKAEELEKQHEGDEVKVSNAVLQEIVHTLPQLFFLSLPFFALFLKLLYWRSRKSAYVEHFIFSIYHYAFLFSIMLLYILFGRLTNDLDGKFVIGLIQWIVLAMIFYPFIYLFLSMKRFYSDSWGKLILRYLVLTLLLLITILTLFVVLAIINVLL
jgi:hypothetical protein